jgi:iron complex outermembrane receptor protein
VVCWSGSAAGQTTRPPRPVDEDAIFADIARIVGASRFEQRASEAPASVSVITRDEIDRFGWRSFAELLASIRGFHTTNDRNYVYLAARGFGRAGDYNSRVLVLIDGVRTNDNVYDAAYLGLESIVSLDQVERVEVIRGPSSSLYGASAVFGVINVITRRGRDVQGTTAHVETASFGTHSGRLSSGHRLSSGLEYFISGDVVSSRGQDLYFPEFDAPETNNGMAVGIDGEQRRSFFGSLSWGELSAHAAMVSREKSVPTGSFGTLFNTPGVRTIDKSFQGKAALDHTFRDNSLLAASISYGMYDYDGSYLYEDGRYDDFARGRWSVAESRYVRSFGVRHRVVAGSEYRLNLRQGQGGATEGVSDFFDDTRRDIWAVFAQDEVRLGSLIVNAGVRHDHYGTFGGTTNPRLALILGARGTTVKLLYGGAFRAPNNYELYYADDRTYKLPTHLGPERIQTTELVAERRLGPHFLLTGSLYRYGLSDLIELVVDPVDSMYVFRNSNRVAARGGEVEIEADLGGVTGRASYSLQRAIEQGTQTRLENSPQHLAKVNLAVPIVAKRVFAGVEAIAMSARLNARREQTPGFALMNFTLSSARGWRGMSASASVYNLFDRRYGDPGATELRQRAIPQDGRSVRLSLQVTR